MRDQITLACNDCKRRNYIKTKNKRLHPDRVEFKKYCPSCRALRSRMCPTPVTHRGIAQLAERRSPKPKVGGSIPSWPANND